MPELSFEERPAIVRTAQAMADFDQLDAELFKLDQDLSWESLRKTSGSSTRLAPFDALPPPPTTNGTVPPPAPAPAPTEPAPPAPLPSRLTLLMRALQPTPPPAATPVSTPGSTPAPPVVPEPPAPVAEDEAPDSLWWSTVGTQAGGSTSTEGAFAGALGAGLPAVPFVSTKVEPAKSPNGKGKDKAADSSPSKVKSAGTEARPNGAKRVRAAGLSGKMRDNWETLRKIKSLHARLGREAANEGPLGPGSDDDEATEDAAPVMRSAYRPRPIPRAMLDSPLAATANRDCVETVSHRVLGHAGFDGSSAMALGVLAHVATEYMLNLGRTLRFYQDRFGARMAPAEVLLHALAENGVPGPQALRDYVQEDIEDYGTQLRAMQGRLERAREEQLEDLGAEAGMGVEDVLDRDAELVARSVLQTGVLCVLRATFADTY